MESSQDTAMLKVLSATKIKVVGLEGCFINSVMQIQSEVGLLDIQVVVNSVNIAKYKIFERLRPSGG